MEVIVIGSGPAGLAAMRRLVQEGVKAICLEAADRIGGRVNTVPFADDIVDLGAVVCEGEKGNVMAEMAKPYDLMQNFEPSKKSYVLSNGDSLKEADVEDYFENIKNDIAKANKDTTESVRHFIENSLKPEFSKNPELTKPLLEWFERVNEYGGQGDPKLGKSLKNEEVRKVCEGAMKVWKHNGMGNILDLLMNKYPDPKNTLPIDILMKKDVDNIKWKTPDNLVQVTCKDGSVFNSKMVISTVSVGVMKERHSYFFTPALPHEKIDTINNLQMFVLDKLFMEFLEPWWTESPSYINVIWSEADKAKFGPEEKWIAEVYGMETVMNQPNVLQGWINDEGAKLMEKASEEDVRKGMDKLLAMLFGAKFNVKPIKTMLRTKWATNRFERGSYSYRSVNTEENGSGADLLGKPLVNDQGSPVICFAGEATHNQYYGSVHGAIETGFREADRVIEYLRK